MEEEWREIEGCPHYEISNCGRVRSYYNKSHGFKSTPSVLAEKIDRIGYSFVHLKSVNGRKPFRIHRLVAKAFIPNPNNLAEVNHIDENKQNNCVDNLEWCTRTYNVRYSQVWKSVIRKIVQLADDNTPIQEWESISEASRNLNIPIATIFSALTHPWKGGGYRWKYAD